MYELSLGGAQQWARPLGGSDDQFMQHQRQPATGSDGSLYLTGMGGANGWSLFRVDPGTGNVVWQRSPFPSNGMSAPSVGPDGSVYLLRSLSYLDSVTPTGRPGWTFSDGAIIDHPAVSPDGSVVVAGSRPNFGQPRSVRGWNAGPGNSSGSSTCLTRTAATRSCTPRHDSRRTAAPRTSAPLYSGVRLSNRSFTRWKRLGRTADPLRGARVVGMQLETARTRIADVGCSVGTVTRVRSQQVGIVLAQWSAPAAAVSGTSDRWSRSMAVR